MGNFAIAIFWILFAIAKFFAITKPAIAKKGFTIAICYSKIFFTIANKKIIKLFLKKSSIFIVFYMKITKKLQIPKENLDILHKKHQKLSNLHKLEEKKVCFPLKIKENKLK